MWRRFMSSLGPRTPFLGRGWDQESGSSTAAAALTKRTAPTASSIPNRRLSGTSACNRPIRYPPRHYVPFVVLLALLGFYCAAVTLFWLRVETRMEYSGSGGNAAPRLSAARAKTMERYGSSEVSKTTSRKKIGPKYTDMYEEGVSAPSPVAPDAAHHPRIKSKERYGSMEDAKATSRKKTGPKYTNTHEEGGSAPSRSKESSLPHFERRGGRAKQRRTPKGVDSSESMGEVALGKEDPKDRDLDGRTRDAEAPAEVVHPASPHEVAAPVSPVESADSLVIGLAVAAAVATAVAIISLAYIIANRRGTRAGEEEKDDGPPQTERGSAAPSDDDEDANADTNADDNYDNLAERRGTDPPPPTNAPVVFCVTVPNNVRPDEEFRVLAGDRIVSVRCPPGSFPGGKLQIVVGEGAAAKKKGNGSDTSASGVDDANVSPAQPHSRDQYRGRLADLDDQRTSGVTNPQEGTSVFEVTVPQGVQPGQPFTVLAEGVKVLVPCPADVSEGRKILFNLPDKILP